MQRVYLFSGNALPLYSSRWGVTEWKRYFNSSNNDDEPIGQKKHTSDNKRRPSVNLSKFKIYRTKRNKKKADYLKVFDSTILKIIMTYAIILLIVCKMSIS